MRGLTSYVTKSQERISTLSCKGTARYNIALNKVEKERNDDVNFLLVLRYTLVTVGDFSGG